MSPKGFGVDALIAKVVEHTPTVGTVQQSCLSGFPEQVAQPIFAGLLPGRRSLGRVYE